jgi:predicted nuclease with TOPRIM domain
MARLEGAYDQINQRLGNLEGEVRALRTELNARMDRLDARMDRLDARMDRLDARLDRLDARIDRLSFLLLALFGGVAASIIATIVARVV